ncbi:MAG: type II secretion system F family protein [Thermoguttaceae bacterium]|jgi:general secretion pathway protein F/type IV pilus assembly protein PilC
MTEFTYIARDRSGNATRGTVTAASRREALAALGGRAIYPTRLDNTVPVARHRRVRRVPGSLLAAAYGQLADLLRSGVPLLRSIEVLGNQTSHAALKSVLGEVHRQVEDGASLADAMGHFQALFGEMAVSMVRAGGEGGFLEEALSRVAEFTEAQDDLKKRTAGAVAYPAFLCVMGTIVVVVLMVFFVPKFGDLFKGLREKNEMPILTEALLAVSAWSRSLWALVSLAGLAGGLWYARRWARTDGGRLWCDRAKLAVPFAGSIFLGLAVSRFCRVLGTLLHNGVPILRSLQISRDATGNRVLAAAIGEATENISAGQSLAGPLGASGRFPPAVVEMIAVAEQANNLENVLLTIATSVERNTWRKLDLAVRLLEPMLLAVVAGMVLILVIALLLPVLKMSMTI